MNRPPLGGAAVGAATGAAAGGAADCAVAGGAPTATTVGAVPGPPVAGVEELAADPRLAMMTPMTTAAMTTNTTTIMTMMRSSPDREDLAYDWAACPRLDRAAM